MGKSLTGKELGVGLSQRKDEYYVARYTDKYGKRQTKIFSKLNEAKKWLSDSKYEDEHSNINKSLDMTLDAWFEYWISIKAKEIKITSVKAYQSLYDNNIKHLLGNMLLSDIKPINCQMIMNNMDTAKNSYMRQTKMLLNQVLEYAVQNDAIAKNPCNKAVKANIGKNAGEKKHGNKGVYGKLRSDTCI